MRTTPRSDPPDRAEVSHLRALGCVIIGVIALLLPLGALAILLRPVWFSDRDLVLELDEEAEIMVLLPPTSAVSTENLHLDPDAPLLFGASDSGGQALFLRFPIELPTGSAVTHADIVFRCADNLDGRGKVPVTCKIEALDAGNQPAYTGRRYGSVEALQRIPRMAEQALRWKVDPWVGGGSYATINLAPLLEAFLQRPDYRPGNAFGLVIRGVESSPASVERQGQIRSVAAFGSGSSPYLRVVLDEP